MAKGRMVYEGKAKILYEGPEPDTMVQYFKDDATAFNAEKKDVIEGKGALNNRLSEHFMSGLNTIGVPTHFIKRLNMREQLIRTCEMIPLEVVVRNIAAGSMSTRLGIEEGTSLPRPIIEFYLKEDELNDPIVSEEHIIAFGWATQQDVDDMIALALLWDVETGEKLDKDVFRRDLGSLADAYTEVAKRLGILPKGGNGSGPKLVH